MKKNLALILALVMLLSTIFAVLPVAAAEAGAKLTADMVVGATEYQKGETEELSGLHLIDEYTYSITISSDYVPYFYELSYASLTPLYIPMYASAPLTVVEGETGAKFEGGELVAAEIDAARWMYADAVPHASCPLPSPCVWAWNRASWHRASAPSHFQTGPPPACPEPETRSQPSHFR